LFGNRVGPLETDPAHQRAGREGERGGEGEREREREREREGERERGEGGGCRKCYAVIMD